MLVLKLKVVGESSGETTTLSCSPRVVAGNLNGPRTQSVIGDDSTGVTIAHPPVKRLSFVFGLFH